jgi:photosystem II stability/assembly factor-like uncharacterized protein
MRGRSTLAILLAGVLCASAAAADIGTIQSLNAGSAHEALFAVSLSGNTGIAVGAAGQLLESADAGAHWKPVVVPTDQALLGVDINAERALAVGQEGVILVRGADGRWSRSANDSTARLFAVHVNASGMAVATGAFGAVLASKDGGRSWTSISPKWDSFTDGDEPHIYAVDVDDSGVITIAGEFGLILRSSDGGANWTALHKGNSSLFAMNLRTDGGGYAVGQDGTVLKTADRGTTWQPVDVGTTANLLSVASGDNGAVYITGMHELLSSADNGVTWQHRAAQASAEPWHAGVAMIGGSTNAIAVGDFGQIVRLEK